MARIGMFLFLGRGHLNPGTALGRCLQARGHEVTVFHLAIAEAAVRAAGLRFRCIDNDEPRETPRSRSLWTRRMRWPRTRDAVHGQARRVLREGPDAVRAAGLDAVLVDQLDLAAGTVAEHAGIPFITLGCAPSMYLHPSLPPPFFGWPHSSGALARLRNRAGNLLVARIARPILASINVCRARWHLPALRGVNDTFSTLAIINQVPEAFDFPCPASLAHLHHAGPFRFGPERSAAPFPWQRLDGRPLVYASMGTIRNDLPWVFEIIAEACAAFDVQLVMSLGGGRLRPEDLPPIAGHPIVAHFAPQAELLARSALTINCAGLNTTLDSIAAGVPMVGIPVAEDQPGVAARIRRARIGAIVPMRALSVPRLRRAIDMVLNRPAYRLAVRSLRRELHGTDGAEQAARLVERVLGVERSTRPAAV